MEFDVGQGVRSTARFTDATGRTADPTTVTVKIKNPAGQTSTPSAVKESKGRYYVDVVLNQAGTWYYRWEGSGAVAAAAEGSLQVRPSQFGGV